MVQLEKHDQSNHHGFIPVAMEIYNQNAIHYTYMKNTQTLAFPNWQYENSDFASQR